MRGVCDPRIGVRVFLQIMGITEEGRVRVSLRSLRGCSCSLSESGVVVVVRANVAGTAKPKGDKLIKAGFKPRVGSKIGHLQ